MYVCFRWRGQGRVGNGQFTKELWKNPDFRAHMIEAHKGHEPWNKGLTADKDNRIPRYWLGKKRSPEIIEKMRQANIGRKRIFSEEHKENLRKVAKRGEDNPLWKGRTKKTCPVCRKIFEVKPSRRNRICCSHHCAMLGPRNFNWKNGRKPSKEHIRKSLRRRIPSSLEEKFQKIINKYNLPYKYVGDGSFIIGHYNPDFINVNGEKIAVEVYARYYKKRHNPEHYSKYR